MGLIGERRSGKERGNSSSITGKELKLWKAKPESVGS
jgi:hypothetical protein